MKKNRGAFCGLAVFICLVFFASNVFGDEADAQVISLEEIRYLALSNSRSLAKYNLTIQSNESNEKSQIYSYLPSLSLSAGASMNLWNSGFTPVENPLNTFKVNFGLSNISVRLFEGGKSFVLNEINTLTTEMSRKDALMEYYNILDSADSAFYAVLEAAGSLEAAETSLRTSENSLSIAEIRMESGMLNQGDFLKAQADRESKNTACNQARRNLSLSISKLKAITGLEEIPGLETVDFGEYENVIQQLGTISDNDANTLFARLLGIVQAQNPSLAKSSLAAAKAEENLVLSEREYLPAISATFNHGLNFTYTPGGTLQSSPGSLSLNASIPLDFWTISNNVKKSKISRDLTLLEHAGTESDLVLKVETALLDAIANAGTVLSSRRSLEYSEKHFEVIMERYQLSQSSLSELLDASALVSSENSQLTRASYGFLRSLSTLRSLGAIEGDEDLIQILSGN